MYAVEYWGALFLCLTERCDRHGDWIGALRFLWQQGIGVLMAGWLLAHLPQSVFAQQQPLPGPIQPQPSPPVQAPPPPEEPAEITITPPGIAAPPGAEQISVVLREIIFEGATVYTQEELEAVYQEDLGKKILLTRIFEIAEQIQDKYREEGYLLTRVIVPPQTVEEGVFRIQVIEGFVDEVQVEGEVGSVRERIKAYLAKVTEIRPVRKQDLERYLLLVNDLPGVRAFGVLRPGVGELGASQLVVEVQRKPFDGYVLANNRGSEFTGPERALLTVRENAGTRFGEQVEALFLSTLASDEQFFGQLAYTQALGDEGLRFRLAASYSPTEPDFTLARFEVETEILSTEVSMSYPLIRSRAKNLYLNFGFQTIDSEVEFSGERLNRDRLRVLFAGAAFDFEDPLKGRSLVSLGIRQGLDALGASEEGEENLSREGGLPDFTSLNAQASRYQPLGDRFGVYLAARGQFSFNTLLSVEEFRVGGEQFGRGYDPSEILGDHGLGLTAEAQYNQPTPFEILPNVQWYAFYDYGVVWNRDLGDAGDSRDSLASTGVGVRTQILKHWFVDLEMANPLTRTPISEGDKDPRFFFQVLARF
ncbi:ShlB/FhaC/HecB family hemolysin secretion/activation protein [Nitrosococcus wardiae]|uniref:ShlB/FhaC/HecB family hemolysin secretion/activation protein n=1 Tax=Nitrosococcus wardiae TaxID=1814290 RepID=A0A4P7BYL9_9GAMM|nr:ShlB/FhaC/HecB family hemolysin secretion/activation protein [Nitrosococcus wardiae]QBQ55171.1 ShlB/FhaC/HecB family hemolysin secretion/activation protein [Nitrosococcus wardiae]